MADPHHHRRVVFVGPGGGSGKTQLIAHYLGFAPAAASDPTILDEHYLPEHDLVLVDTASRDEFWALTKDQLARADVVVFVFDAHGRPDVARRSLDYILRDNVRAAVVQLVLCANERSHHRDSGIVAHIDDAALIGAAVDCAGVPRGRVDFVRATPANAAELWARIFPPLPVAAPSPSPSPSPSSSRTPSPASVASSPRGTTSPRRALIRSVSADTEQCVIS